MQLKAAVAFEMITSSQDKLLHKQRFVSSEQLINVLDREENGWEYARYYKPVFSSTMRAEYQILPANLPRKQVINIVSKGANFVPERIKRILSENELTEQHKKSMQNEIHKSHCNMTHPQMVEAMMLGQRVKDAVMAISMDTIKGGNKVILIAGSGHTRNDRGVPIYLNKLDGERKVASLSFMEVESGHNNVSEYHTRWGGTDLPFDYVWFTERVQREDPCTELRRHFKQKKASHAAADA